MRAIDDCIDIPDKCIVLIINFLYIKNKVLFNFIL